MKSVELSREPILADVNAECEVGGFKLKVLLIMAALGLTDVPNKRSFVLSEGVARAGIPMAIGENVVNMRGYDRRSTSSASTASTAG